MLKPLLLAVLMTVAGAGAGSLARADEPAAGAPAGARSAAETLYAEARPRLVQVRTVLGASGSDTSTGSGFLAGPGNLAITNYHVVSQFALEPSTYRLEYAAADGSKGAVELVAIDVANDLALLRLSGDHERPWFAFDDRALAGGLPNGERIYSLGNPLNLGFTIVDGTWNGPVDRSYSERIHFSGALNPGMSGGPAMTAEGRIVGINVAKQLGSELVSFLVPARFAAALLDRHATSPAPPPATLRAEIARQLAAWSAGLYDALGTAGFRSAAFGPWRAAESAAPWFTCGAFSNAEQVPRPRAQLSETRCRSGTQLFVAHNLVTGQIAIQNIWLRSGELNAFAFAEFVTRHYGAGSAGGWTPRWQTPQRCHDDFVDLDAAGTEHPALRAVWCARAYRDFPGLYDVALVALTQDSGSEALVSRLTLQGVGYEAALALGRRFLEELRWTR